MAQHSPTVQIRQSHLFDRLVHKQVAFYDQKFPAHFHPNFSIRMQAPSVPEQVVLPKDTHIIFDHIIDYFAARLKDKITLDDLCNQFKYEKFKLLRQFKQYTGLSPINYLIALRIETAKKLMFSDLSLVQIALESGFYDQSHFSNCFLKFVGLTPKVYRMSCLK